MNELALIIPDATLQDNANVKQPALSSVSRNDAQADELQEVQTKKVISLWTDFIENRQSQDEIKATVQEMHKLINLISDASLNVATNFDAIEEKVSKQIVNFLNNYADQLVLRVVCGIKSADSGSKELEKGLKSLKNACGPFKSLACIERIDDVLTQMQINALPISYRYPGKSKEDIIRRLMQKSSV